MNAQAKEYLKRFWRRVSDQKIVSVSKFWRFAQKLLKTLRHEVLMNSPSLWRLCFWSSAWRFWRQKFWWTSPAFKTWSLWRPSVKESWRPEVLLNVSSFHGLEVLKNLAKIRWFWSSFKSKSNSSEVKRRKYKCPARSTLGWASVLKGHFQLCKKHCKSTVRRWVMNKSKPLSHNGSYNGNIIIPEYKRDPKKRWILGRFRTTKTLKS